MRLDRRRGVVLVLAAGVAAWTGCGGNGGTREDSGLHVNPKYTRTLPVTETEDVPAELVPVVEATFAFVEDPVPLDRPAHVKLTVVNRTAQPVLFNTAPPYVNVLQERKLIYLDFNSVKDLSGTLWYPLSNVHMKGAGPTLALKEVPPGARAEGLFEVDLRPGKVTAGAWDVYAIFGSTSDTTMLKDLNADRVKIWMQTAKTSDYTWSVQVK